MIINKMIAALSILFTFSTFAESTHLLDYSKLFHKESGLRISIKSDTDGVCIYSGFDRGLKGSKKKQRVHRKTKDKGLIILDQNGKVVRQARTVVLGQITCIKN